VRARASAGRGADAVAARWLGVNSVVDGTAAGYGGLWGSFAGCCGTHGLRALPACTERILAYVGHLWRRNSVVAVSLKTIFDAIRTRHVAAGQPNSCDHASVRETKAGFRRAGLLYRPVIKPVRVPLPSTVSWRLAELAMR